MKYMIASDIHGSAWYCRKMMEALEKEQADRLILLGDLLYHGPRNDLPKEYAPKEVIRMLNKEKNRIYNVRGNCDAEVDQMVLEFPVLADYGWMEIDGKTFYMSHGHIYNEHNLPTVKTGRYFHAWAYSCTPGGKSRGYHDPESGFRVNSEGRESTYLCNTGKQSIHHQNIR